MPTRSSIGGCVLPRLDSYHRQFPAFRVAAPRPPSEYIKEQIFDTATTHRPAIRCAVETLSTDRLVFGSDYPHIPSGTQPFIEALDAIDADEETMHQIFTGRAVTLLAGDDI